MVSEPITRGRRRPPGSAWVTAVTARTAVNIIVFNMSPALALAADSDAGSNMALYALIVPLLLVMGAAVAATLVLKRWRVGLTRRDGPLQLVHVIAVGPREKIALLKTGSRYLVVGITPGSITRLAALSDIQEAASGAPPAQEPHDGPSG